ncbi:hypothetical protein AALP_AAs48252U000900 [Arabis alpina]|uniref:Uncharacterized protein n=1 Tax=Arabis alpina TaxID=50452 RepID=A0A087FWF8_ARAAL|nr:hypothetical protein AALP_AAs48252U000900 [Arabis alpina]
MILGLSGSLVVCFCRSSPCSFVRLCSTPAASGFGAGLGFSLVFWVVVGLLPLWVSLVRIFNGLALGLATLQVFISLLAF